jgi:hypothetical protein
MQAYPLSAVVLLVWIWAVRRDLDNSALVVAAMLPLGMFSILSLGGFSLLASDFLAAMTIGVATLLLVARRPQSVFVSPSAIPLMLFAAYATFASTVLVRLFSGQVQVFAFNRLYDGERVSVHFSGAKNALAPGAANISQVAYILLAVFFFLFLSSVGRRKGTEFLIRGIVAAGLLNVILAVLDLAGTDGLLGFVRTADYALLSDHSVSGLPRVIGGFAEASAFGAYSSGFGAFLLVFGLKAGRPRLAMLGALNLLAAALSLSSTGFVGLLTLSAIGGVFFLGVLRRRNSALALSAIGAIFAIALGLIALVLLLASDRFLIGGILDRLLLSKFDSVSGMERLAMAQNGLEVFMVTWGLGAGAGSVLASGYFFAVLGAVGIPGAVFLIWFFAQAFFGRATGLDQTAAAARTATQVFLVVWMAVIAASAVTPSPGLLAFFMAAIAESCRQVAKPGMAVYSQTRAQFGSRSSAAALFRESV